MGQQPMYHFADEFRGPVRCKISKPTLFESLCAHQIRSNSGHSMPQDMGTAGSDSAGNTNRSSRPLRGRSGSPSAQFPAPQKSSPKLPSAFLPLPRHTRPQQT